MEPLEIKRLNEEFIIKFMHSSPAATGIHWRINLNFCDDKRCFEILFDAVKNLIHANLKLHNELVEYTKKYGSSESVDSEMNKIQKSTDKEKGEIRINFDDLYNMCSNLYGGKCDMLMESSRAEQAFIDCEADKFNCNKTNCPLKIE